jgi:hypothetical protein
MKGADFSTFVHSSDASYNERDDFLSIRSLIGRIMQRRERISLHSFTHRSDHSTNGADFSSFVHSSDASCNERDDFLYIRSLIGRIMQRRERISLHSSTHRTLHAMNGGDLSPFVHSSGESCNERSRFLSIRPLIGRFMQ